MKRFDGESRDGSCGDLFVSNGFFFAQFAFCAVYISHNTNSKSGGTDVRLKGQVT